MRASTVAGWQRQFFLALRRVCGIGMPTWHDLEEPHEAKVMPDGRMSLPADLRRRHGLANGGEVIVEDMGAAIVLRTLDQVVARAGFKPPLDQRQSRGVRSMNSSLNEAIAALWRPMTGRRLNVKDEPRPVRSRR